MNITDFIPLGIENAITQEELAIRLNCDKRTARAAVFDARRKGAVICSTCGNSTAGYYIPLSADEAKLYIRMQEKRIKSARAAIRSTKEYIKKTEGNA